MDKIKIYLEIKQTGILTMRSVVTGSVLGAQQRRDRLLKKHEVDLCQDCLSEFDILTSLFEGETL